MLRFKIQFCRREKKKARFVSWVLIDTPSLGSCFNPCLSPAFSELISLREMGTLMVAWETAIVLSHFHVCARRPLFRVHSPFATEVDTKSSPTPRAFMMTLFSPLTPPLLLMKTSERASTTSASDDVPLRRKDELPFLIKGTTVRSRLASCRCLYAPLPHTHLYSARREMPSLSIKILQRARSILTFYIADLFGLFERIMHIA